MSLRSDLARYGFESNADYSFALQCVLDAEARHVRCLHVDGSAGRRKTAFANALGLALAYPRVCYHDFTLPEPPRIAVEVSADEVAGSVPEPQLSAFERVITLRTRDHRGLRLLRGGSLFADSGSVAGSRLRRSNAPHRIPSRCRVA